MLGMVWFIRIAMQSHQLLLLIDMFPHTSKQAQIGLVKAGLIWRR
jgi:hypothetical protein